MPNNNITTTTTTTNNNNNNTTTGSWQFIRAVEEAFFLLDRDQDRLINEDDFCNIAKSVGIDLHPDEASTLIRTTILEQTDDHVEEAELTVDQYSTLMLRYVGSSELNEELRKTFDAFDRDHDGIITRQDMDKLRYETSFFNQLDDEQYELVVKELLIQGNNSTGLDFNRFVILMMNQ
ncbi:unnamed protein product [Rotaria socialis]|uniref:EF-hand domain-containing protein n=1 Tax=Rotaria socialis TaxID=392032 RepID=A0A817VEI1_9BILA|nr:unnamed protein product [Rotaria socialis]CAF3451717.1 unnamed protein product [Rotaria socialis]CAF4170853.1 unnamed protein product [Rotaria socialis]CAF4384277.1 unnamed protein product [Rotaria socialis]